MEASISDILANRGEGSMLAYRKLELEGGGATVQGRSDARQGTEFCFFVPTIFETKMEFPCREKSSKILLIDDALLQMKMMLRNIFKTLNVSEDERTRDFKLLTES